MFNFIQWQRPLNGRVLEATKVKIISKMRLTAENALKTFHVSLCDCKTDAHL